MNDTNIEMQELRQAAQDAAHNREAGNCDHGWTGTNPESTTGGFKCYYCGKLYLNVAARDAEEESIREQNHNPFKC